MKNLSLFPLDYSMIEIESRNFQAMEWKEQDKTNIICTTRHKNNKEKKIKTHDTQHDSTIQKQVIKPGKGI